MNAKDILLFNPTSIVHYRNIALLAQRLSAYDIRCILNPRFPWVKKIERAAHAHCYFDNARLPLKALKGVKGVIIFSAQPRLPAVSLIQEAVLNSIPVVAVQEVHQMMLEQGYVNEYFLPVDRLFCNSEFERQKLLAFGIPHEVLSTSGCMFACAASKPSNAQNTKQRLNIPK